MDLKHVEHFISVIGAFEDQIFQKRARLLQRQKQRRERDKANKHGAHQPGQGQAGSKWKAAVPNASFTASLQPVGHHQSGTFPFALSLSSLIQWDRLLLLRVIVCVCLPFGSWGKAKYLLLVPGKQCCHESACYAGKTAMLTPTGQAPHIPFHLGPTQAGIDTPTPTDGMAGSAGTEGQVQLPPGLGRPPGLSQPTSNMSAAQQLKDRLMKGEPMVHDCYTVTVKI